MFRYILRFADGSDAGEAAYGAYILPGEVIVMSIRGLARPFRVLDLVPVADDDSPYDGVLRLELA
jgi:hypothetical protein